MILSYLHGLVDYLHHHPYIGLLITFLAAFGESLALIGSIIPGSVIMTAIGALIGSGIMPITATLIVAIIGAFLGDLVSFWIGAHYNEQLRRIWPFRSHPHWLIGGENFFRKHGGKSVVLGRFFGPMRSAVPLIAGLVHMPLQRFIIAALPSAAMWALLYIAPGILVGQLALELPPHLATIFILSVLGIVAFGWIIFLIIHLFLKKIMRIIDLSLAKYWTWLTNHRKTAWIPKLLSYPQATHPHQQLMLLSAAVISGLLFIWVAMNVICHVGSHVNWTHLNDPVFILFRSLRNHFGENFMILGTVLGDKLILLPAAVLIAVWLLWKRYYWAALHWFGLIVVTASSVELIKHLYYSARPSGLLHGSTSSSFPSGHTVLSVGFYGFLAAVIAQNLLKDQRKIPYWIATVIIIWVSLSRLYLGAHWLTDVVGGIFLGLTWVWLATLSYCARPHKTLPYKQFSAIAIAIILVLSGGYAVMHFRSLQYDYTLSWPKVAMDKSTWWQHGTDDIPLFVVSRLGKPREILNIQWLGDLDGISRLLTSQGWETHPSKVNWKGTLSRLSMNHSTFHLPLLPALYQNQTPVLLLTKTNNQHQQLNLMLWKSNVVLTDSSQTLWLGTLHYYIHPTKKEPYTAIPQQIQTLYTRALTELMANLHSQQWKIVTIPPEQQPGDITPLGWDGRLLLIQGNR